MTVPVDRRPPLRRPPSQVNQRLPEIKQLLVHAHRLPDRATPLEPSGEEGRCCDGDTRHPRKLVAAIEAAHRELGVSQEKDTLLP